MCIYIIIMAMAWFHIHTSPLLPAEYPCWQHLTCRPIWMGPLQPSQQPRAVCTSAVCRPGSWGRVCHHHCLLHQRTAQLACSYLCFQVFGEATLEKRFRDSKEGKAPHSCHLYKNHRESLVHFITRSMHAINPGTWFCPLNQQIKRHEIVITIYVCASCIWSSV